MRMAMLLLLACDVLNLLTFASIACVGLPNGVIYPFPRWFRNATDVCFYLGLAFTVVSLLFFLARQQRKRALLSTALAFGTVMIIAFLTTRG